jgi:hypothetical protein
MTTARRESGPAGRRRFALAAWQTIIFIVRMTPAATCFAPFPLLTRTWFCAMHNDWVPNRTFCFRIVEMHSNKLIIKQKKDAAVRLSASIASVPWVE